MISKLFGRRKILFIHIPKTGGTAVKQSLIQQFKPSRVHLIYGLEYFQKGVREFAENNKQLGVGHFGWEKDMTSWFEDAFKMTFLRHPVQRVISHYWHFQRSPHEGDQYLKAMSFEEFLETRFAQNWQTQKLGGGFYDQNMSDEESFEEALINVSERFQFVGITERMQESVDILNKELSLNISTVAPRNVNPNKDKEDQMVEDFSEAILAKNQHDMKLYEVAVERLDNALVAQWG